MLTFECNIYCSAVNVYLFILFMIYFNKRTYSIQINIIIIHIENNNMLLFILVLTFQQSLVCFICVYAENLIA